MSDSQGGEANKQGKANRDDVEGILRRHDFHLLALENMKGSKALAAIQEATQQLIPITRVFTTHPEIGVSIHGAKLFTDFLLYQKGWLTPLAIYCKHQSKAGSALHKLEHLFANIDEQYPCPCIAILEGPEFSEPVYQRAEKWVVRSKGRLAKVFRGVQDFRRWVTGGCVYPEFQEPEPLLPI